MSYPVTFVDDEGKVKYSASDTVLTMSFKSNGFEFLARNTFKNRTLVINVDKLNIDLSKGRVSIPSSRLKTQIINSLPYNVIDISISPQNVFLTWNKIYSKRIKVVNQSLFKYKKPYDGYYPPKLLIDEVVIEGKKQDIEKIDKIYTRNICFENIDKSKVFLVPLNTDSLNSNIRLHISSVPIKIETEEFTEDVVTLPLKVIRYDDYKNIRVFPKNVKIKYRVAMKDYRKFNPNDISAFVFCSGEQIGKSDRLKVNLNNVPSYIRVVGVYPEKVEYILFK